MTECRACRAGDHIECSTGAWAGDRPAVCDCYREGHGDPEWVDVEQPASNQQATSEDQQI